MKNDLIIDEQVMSELRMNDTTARCKFHPVGQGLFYSAILRNGDKTFSMVYDCGSMTKTSRKKSGINDLVSQLDQSETGTKKCLNVLVISHFHEDHINMIPALLEEVDVETVIMPYYCETERLFYAAQISQDATLTEKKFMVSFYSNPEEYFRTNGVKQIIYLDGNERNSEEYNNIGARKIEEDTVFYDKIQKDEKLYWMPIYNKKFRLVVRLGNDWAFRFCITKELKCQEYADLKSEINSILDKNSLCEAIKDRNIMSDLREKYKKYLGNNLNIYSVVCLHYPLSIDNDVLVYPMEWIKKEREYINCYHKIFSYRYLESTLLTGDETIQAEEWETIFKGMPYGHRAKPLVLLIPHHGGSISEYSGVYNIVSYETDNRYKHPYFSVINKILDCPNSKVGLVNESSYGFEYVIECRG